MGVRPIKIVRILARMNIGGPAIHATLLTDGLNERQFQSILATGTIGATEGDMSYLAHFCGITPIVIPELGREISWRDDLIALWKLYRVLVREHPDIVHTHTAKAGALGRVAAVLAGVRIRIHTFHGHVFHGYFGPLKTNVFVVIERLLALFSTKIVAISQSQLADLADRYRIAARDKFTVIPIGLDLSPFLALDRGQGHDQACGYEAAIGFVGRLVAIKNPQMALRVFARLVEGKPKDQQLRLLICGNGDLRVQLEDQVRELGLSHEVEFAGWRHALVDLYASLDLVILTSHNEGTPVALIEAMASGLPFVATRVGGVSDLVVGSEHVVRSPGGRSLFWLFDNGILTEPEDVEGFTAAVQYLLQDRVRMKRMGMEGRRFVKDRFSKERLVHDIEALYHECYAERNHSLGRVVRDV